MKQTNLQTNKQTKTKKGTKQKTKQQVALTGLIMVVLPAYVWILNLQLDRSLFLDNMFFLISHFSYKHQFFSVKLNMGRIVYILVNLPQEVINVKMHEVAM